MSVYVPASSSVILAPAPAPSRLKTILRVVLPTLCVGFLVLHLAQRAYPSQAALISAPLEDFGARLYEWTHPARSPISLPRAVPGAQPLPPTNATITVTASPIPRGVLAPPVLGETDGALWDELTDSGTVGVSVRVRYEPEFILWQDPQGTVVYWRRHGSATLFDPLLFYRETTIPQIMDRLKANGYPDAEVVVP